MASAPIPKRSLHDFWNELAEWSQRTFGPDQVRGPQGPLKHLQLEVAEVLANPTDLTEYADCLFLVYDACRRAGFGHEQLIQAAWAKLEVNRLRQWGPPSGDAPVQHIRT